MSIPRIYQPISLSSGETQTLTLSAAHYLGQVRRTREGDSVILFNGNGGEYQAEVLSLKKDKITVKIGSFSEVHNESPLSVELAQGIARGEKMDFIIQKAVELGAKRIIPLFTERSNVKLDPDKRLKRQQHWQAVAVSACEQSGRAVIPEVALPIELGAWLKTFKGRGLTLSPLDNTRISGLEVQKGETLTLLVGPEGGLSAAEVALTEQKDFSPLNLGPRILRTETAPLAALALLQARFGDLS